MSKQNQRPSIRKLSSFDIRSIPKNPPAPSLDRRRRTRAGVERTDVLRMRNKGEQ
jgi:hypothetical protein